MTAAATLVIEYTARDLGRHMGSTNAKAIKWVNHFLPQIWTHPKLQAAQSKDITDEKRLPEKMQLTIPMETIIQLLMMENTVFHLPLPDFSMSSSMLVNIEYLLPV
jgi:hypothetical protein